MEGNCRKFLQGASVWAAWRERGSAILRNENEFRKTAGRRWSAWLNPNYSQIGTYSFPFSANKSRKRWISSQSGYCSSSINDFEINLPATKINFEKLPPGGGARGRIRDIPESSRLFFHFRRINWGKGGQHRAMVSIMQEIHVLFMKWYILSNRSKCAHKGLPKLLACNEGVISIICMLVGVTRKCWFQWKFDRQLHHWLSPFYSLFLEYRDTQTRVFSPSCKRSLALMKDFSLFGFSQRIWIDLG